MKRIQGVVDSALFGDFLITRTEQFATTGDEGTFGKCDSRRDLLAIGLKQCSLIQFSPIWSVIRCSRKTVHKHPEMKNIAYSGSQVPLRNCNTVFT